MEKDECNGGWLGVVEVGRERLSLVGYGRVWLGVVKHGWMWWTLEGCRETVGCGNGRVWYGSGQKW